MKRFLKIVIFITVTLLILFSGKPVLAATRTWDGGGADNNWSTCANWSSDTCPTELDYALFNATSTKDSVVDSAFTTPVLSLSMSAGYTGTITLQRALTLGREGSYGDFSQTTGTFNQDQQALYVQGVFSHTGGTFNTTNSTVYLSGKKQTIVGSTTFNNLYIDSGSNEIAFTAGTTQTILGELLIAGLSPMNPVYMHSTSEGQKWFIDPQGTQNVSNVDVQDSTNLNSSLIQAGTGSFDRGNNTGWVFPGLVTPVKTIDMANPNNWNIRFDGPVANGWLAAGGILTEDLDGDGMLDIVASVPADNYDARTSCGALYIIYNTTLKKFSGKGNVLDLTNSANYDVKIVGPASSTSYLGGFGSLKIADLRGDGTKFLLVTAAGADFNSRANSGSLYVIPLSLLGSVGTDKVIDLADTNNFTLRFDGAAAGHQLGYGNVVETADLDDDHKTDIIVGTRYTTYHDRSPTAGSLYLMYNTLFGSELSGHGKTYDLNELTSFNLRYDGAGLGGELGMYRNFAIADLKKRGKTDLIFGEAVSRDAGYTFRGSLYIIYNETYRKYTGTGNIVDLLDTTNFNVRMFGARDRDSFANYGPIPIKDINSDGVLEIIVGAYGFMHSELEHAGALYVIPTTVFTGLKGTGNILYVSDTRNFGVRFDGVEYWGLLSDMNVSLSDYFNTGKYDIVTGGPVEPDGFKGSEQGYVYVIKNSQISKYKGRGNIVKMSDSKSYTLLYKGVLGSHLITALNPITGARNLYGTGSNDQIFSAHYTSYNGRYHAGSLYIVYNFPHTIHLDSSSSNVGSLTTRITGSIVASDSVTTVKGVQYSVDMSTYSGTWKSCSAADGSFNSLTESFSCTVDLTTFADGKHNIRIRAYDDNGSYTPTSGYKVKSISYDNPILPVRTTTSEHPVPSITESIFPSSIITEFVTPAPTNSAAPQSHSGGVWTTITKLLCWPLLVILLIIFSLYYWSHKRRKEHSL